MAWKLNEVSGYNGRNRRERILDVNIMSDNKKRKTMVSVLFMGFSIIFTVCLIASNILETKQMVFGPLHLTGGQFC